MASDRTEHIAGRMTDEEAEVVRRAAGLCETTISDIVRRGAYREAREMLRRRRVMVAPLREG